MDSLLREASEGASSSFQWRLTSLGHCRHQSI